MTENRRHVLGNEKSNLQYKDLIWVSHEWRCIYFRSRAGCERMSFVDHKEMMEYVYSLSTCGYRIG